MAHQSALIAEDIHAFLKAQEQKSLLRFITCGSVDDGKSTLIGRLLWDSKMVFEDQLAALESDSRKVGTQGEKIDYALLLDGLQAEREQGITIDVAYRYFSTDKRKFIVADTPGHEQYTRNMVTGASNAQVAVILVDARKGLLTQTRRHSYLVSLVGIRNVVLAINKMDLVDYSASRFEALRKEYALFAAQLGFDDITAIPISALEGDNVISASERTPWYQGPSLMEHLETVAIADAASDKPFRMRVQWVNRPHLDFRGFCGTIASGSIRVGDAVIVTASGQTSRVARIVTMDGDLEVAGAGQAITLTLEDEIDISRGDLLAAPEQSPHHSTRFKAQLVWLHETALQPQRSYLLKAGATTAPARVTDLESRVNVNTLQAEPGGELAMNEVGYATLEIDQPLSFDTYRDNRASGSFILIDRLSNATVGAGMIVAPLTPSAAKEHHDAQESTLPLVWIGGRDAAQVAEKACAELGFLGLQPYHLDCASLRRELNSDLGTTQSDLHEEQRRLLAVASLLRSAGHLVVISSSGSPNLPAGIDDIVQLRIGENLDPAEAVRQATALVKQFLDNSAPDLC